MLLKDISYLNEDFDIVKNASILIEDNVILKIVDTPPPDYSGEIYSGKNKLAMAGFYNLHSHLPMVLLRGYGEDLPLDRWLNQKIFPFEDHMDGQAMYWGALLGIAEMVASGTVSLSDMYMLIEGITSAVEESGIKANISRGITLFDERGYKDLDGYKETVTLLDYTSKSPHDRIICDLSIHAEYTATERLIEGIVSFAGENKLGIHLHLSETQKEHLDCKERRGKTPTEFFAGKGVFNSRVTAAHCVWLEDCDMDILLKHNATVAHCPTSNLKLGSGVASVWKMNNLGINVAIGTDGAASNNNLDILKDIQLAALLQKGITNDPACMDLKTVFKMATINGAKAQGRQNCGVIKEGYRADMVVFNLDKPHLQPSFSPLANILYSAKSSDICMTIVDGKVLYKDGLYTTLDIEKIIYHCCKIQGSILNKLKTAE